MRSSGTLMNVAAVVAVTLATGSLWHAYKVRYASDEVVEQAAAGDAPPAQTEAAPAAVLAAPPAAVLAEPPPEPVKAAQPATTANTPAPTEVATGAPVTTEPPPARIATAAEAVPPSPPARSPLSLRDPRQLSLPTAVDVVPPPARVSDVQATIAPTAGRTLPVLADLLDRRSLNAGALSTAAPDAPQSTTSQSEASPRGTATAMLRDVRPIAAPRVQDPRSLVEVRPQPAPGAVSAEPALATTVSLSQSSAVTPAGAACGQPEIATEPMDGGLMRVQTTSVCRANQDVQLSYGGAVLIRRLDAAGRLDFTLDCFAGTRSELVVTFADGTRDVKAVTAKDLDKVSKTAVIWSAPVNLDLHAFEYSALPGKAGHVWERATSTHVAAREIALAGQRGRGYLSTSDDGRTLGDKLEVYTFLHHEKQTSGSIAIGLDYETRGEIPSGPTCGSGALAEVRYQVVTLRQGGQIALESGIFTAASCGQRIGPQVRFDPLLLPALRLHK